MLRSIILFLFQFPTGTPSFDLKANRIALYETIDDFIDT